MRGSEKVIARLNDALAHELGAVSQYWLHYRLLDDMGLDKMARKEREESIEEMQHADLLVKRIIFLEGHPNMQAMPALRIGKTVKEIIEADLAGELDALAAYKTSREVCAAEGDYVTMELFTDLLKDEDGHVDFLETQLTLLAKIGEAAYAQLNASGSAAAE